MNQIFLYLASAIALLWGISHLFPTRSVVAGFGDISVDNRHIITMEWIIEGVALIFIGALVATVTYIDFGAAVSTAMYVVTAVTLIVLAVVSLFTGFNVDFLPFKLCPFIFSAAAVLILLGALL